jgi:Leucine-rich repeat (LRR) protein
MTSLVKLTLKRNKFTELTGNFWSNLVNLSELDASHNLITTISDDFGSLSKLTLLDLSHNQISTIPAGWTVNSFY